MFALVKCTDGRYCVCNHSNVIKRNNGNCYLTDETHEKDAVHLVAVNDNQSIVDEIAANLNMGVPRALLVDRPLSNTIMTKSTIQNLQRSQVGNSSCENEWHIPVT
ncbi:uncharacterized protein LOC105702503 [Orussus abietinus]|uniref:uncharacterized protein LOC105702503 n=1 Tax=Orussus abietinus TaxID=222816 RepID=UPI000626A41B|nr:uncharacterized protein LOC105702500 isoform X2 [Orussus abietinus]XP_012285549.1 uncharacterized protein LOC105702503 [Orussus abietinus]